MNTVDEVSLDPYLHLFSTVHEPVTTTAREGATTSPPFGEETVGVFRNAERSIGSIILKTSDLLNAIFPSGSSFGGYICVFT